tara:strand:- start:364 stop:534 length:171 start_codon:yes stop_codon:yes gene_type:complete
MTELRTVFTKDELEAIYDIVEMRKLSLAFNNCYGKDYDMLGSIIKKIEVSIRNNDA